MSTASRRSRARLPLAGAVIRSPRVPPRSAKTAALTSISTTPYAAATPTSDCRRLDRISSETGRVS